MCEEAHVLTDQHQGSIHLELNTSTRDRQFQWEEPSVLTGIFVLFLARSAWPAAGLPDASRCAARVWVVQLFAV